MQSKTVVAGLAVVLTGCLATWAPPFDERGPRRTALVLLDLQRDFLEEDGRLPIAAAQVDALVQRATRLVEEARRRGLPVVRVHNVSSPADVFGNAARHGAAIRGSAGAEADGRIPAGEDAHFDKEFPDAFTRPALDRWLRDRDITHLVITGVFADGCVYWTSRGARNRHLAVTLVQDGVGAASDDQRADALDRLRGFGVQVVESDEEITW